MFDAAKLSRGFISAQVSGSMACRLSRAWADGLLFLEMRGVDQGAYDILLV